MIHTPTQHPGAPGAIGGAFFDMDQCGIVMARQHQAQFMRAGDDGAAVGTGIALVLGLASGEVSFELPRRTAHLVLVEHAIGVKRLELALARRHARQPVRDHHHRPTG